MSRSRTTSVARLLGQMLNREPQRLLPLRSRISLLIQAHGSRSPWRIDFVLQQVYEKTRFLALLLINIKDIINRIIWDPAFDGTNYVIGYEDRFEGRLESGFNAWKKETTDEEFIPQHRILYIKRRSDGEIVWDRRRRIDKIFYSGNSAFDYLGFLA